MKHFIKKAPCSKTIFLFILLYSFQSSGQMEFKESVTKSEIRLTADGYRIFLNGKPFFVKGAGIDVKKGNFELLAKHGANSFRTWSTDNGRAILDKAHELGLKVMMGIWVGLERHGFDYNDKRAVRQQLKSIRKQVEELKDHPALLVWGIGNELNLLSKNPKVWNAVNDISKMIHKIDPHHLTTTSLSNIDRKDVDFIAKRAPDIDFLSVQVYGGIEVLTDLIKKSTYKGGLLVTEWGATGYWEVAKTTWGAPIENNSTVKADLYRSRYKKSIMSQKQVMG
ncbi:MAG: glycoside hydrolase family 2 TIM barrel-domain containing protein, partial [Kangiellaceae bacterium]|nr:glycoside hydrolase family 2 TIM barrel-domain containing protein [Kangiellaceae bacterium]